MRALALACLLAGCGSHHTGSTDGGSLDGLAKLEVLPADQTLVIDNGVAATSQYQVLGEFPGGRVEDVTAYVQLSVTDGTLGSFDTQASFTSGTAHGGLTKVTAQYGSVSGSTSLALVFRQTWPDPGSPGLPANPGALFGGADDPARAPGLVYPNDNVLVPPNLGQLEFHFHPGTGNTVFELDLQNIVTDIKVYLACTPLNGGCVYLPDPQLWAWLANTNRGGQPVTWTIRGTDATGSAVGTSGAMHLGFALRDVTGGIYYWTTTTQAIMRYDFAGTQTVAQKYAGTELENTCIGCHALSRDGTKLVAEVNGQNDGRTALVDIASKTVMNSFGGTPKSMFESWDPAGAQYVSVYGDSGATDYNLHLLDGQTAALVTTIDVGGTAQHPSDHPDWSADGQRIVYVQVGIAGTMQRMWNGSIYQVSKQGAGWSAPQAIVAASGTLENNYYPAYAPDGRLLVFDHSTCTSGSSTGGECNADTNPTATLMAIDSIALGSPVALANANQPGVADGATTALTNSFPKWDPFVFDKTDQGGHLAWITFSSKRMFGLRSPGSGTLLWMAAIDLDAPAGADPSFVSFALPFQDLSTSNHIAQWTTQIVPIQ